MDFLTRDELLELLKVAKLHSTRDWFMILLGYTHGMRATEIVHLRVQDIKDGSITIARAKGSKTTVQPLEPHAGQPLLDEVKAFKAYMVERPKNWGDTLFQATHGGPMSERWFYNLFRKYATLANLPDAKRHPHVLKHSVANHLIRNGLDIAKVQVRLGHASIGSTMKYIALNDAEVAVETRSALMRMF